MEAQSLLQLYSEFKGSLTLMELSQRKKNRLGVGGAKETKQTQQQLVSRRGLSQDDLAGKSREKPEVCQACPVARTVADRSMELQEVSKS